MSNLDRVSAGKHVPEDLDVPAPPGAAGAVPDASQTAPAFDAGAAAQAWQAHGADASSAALAARLGGDVGLAPLEDPGPEFRTLDDFYREQPAERRALDDAIAVAERAFIAGALSGDAAEAKRGGALHAALVALKAALERTPPDLPAIVAASDGADRAFLDFASKGDPAARAVMQGMYGRSALGGGALGSVLAQRLKPLTGGAPLPGAGAPPEGYALLDAARGGDYVRKGSSGPEVAALARALNAAGADPPLAEDGAFGPALEAAVRKFQRERGCAVDGIVGPETLGALDQALGLPPRQVASASPGGEVAQVPGVFAGGSGAPAGLAAISVAQTQLGVREATGNNDGIPAERYSFGHNAKWCANFAAWSFRQAGHPLPGNQRAIGSCDVMRRELAARGGYFPRGEGTPRPGDLIFFGSAADANHVGIVSKVENGKVYTIEGNSGNRVATHAYDLGSSRIAGFGRWEG